MNKATFKALLRQGNLREIFISEMGWNNYPGTASLPVIRIDEHAYHFTTIAERSGLQVLECIVAEIPTPALCRRIDVRLRRIAQDYIAIYRLQDSEHHQWVTPVRKVDKRDIVTIEYATVEQADFLYEKIRGLIFGLEEVTTIVDVQQRIQQTFAVNSERITKDFYRGFRKEHHEFVSFITGIDDQIGERDNRNKQWYASVMLNRLMFCYFIQKKGFLDQDTDYLNNKLRWCQEQHGEGQFYKSFYRDFLVHLFRDGLNRPGHDPHFEERFGRIPYLNGGMFDLHQIERDYQEIDIADEAFERLFKFFDQWRWHLDTRISATGRDINPDVLGYIFEQYINDRAQMGAYYTKEDITEYIGRNCILPYLLDKVSHATQEMRTLFAPQGAVWQMLQTGGARYLFAAARHGYTADWREQIPQEVAQGLDTTQPHLLERRAEWNSSTPATWGLPTEIWRETIERLQHCDETLAKIQSGEIHEANDFITYNLDIRTFVQDLLEQTESHRLIAHCYKTLREVTILDPTCGSGAFLFAAMNILEPLYETCISRMESFHSEHEQLFVDELGEIESRYRSNIQYFIYKSIILRNLYGVDIMAEAVEIAKLRLFLKMVAVVEVDQRVDNLGLDPLPDIDFNIRCGNTLVGYATEHEIYQAYSADIFTSAEYEQLAKTEMQKVSMAYRRFRDIQLTQQEDMESFVTAKVELRERLAAFNDLLNLQLYKAVMYGKEVDYDRWLADYQPFHWIAEYYEIIAEHGGFDVIIGNPPYVGYTKKNKDTKVAVCDVYQLSNYRTLPTSNLYAFIIERSSQIMKPESRIGMIIPIQAFSNDKMKELQSLFRQQFGDLFLSSFHQRPAQLFEGVLQRLSIFLTINRHNVDSRFYTTRIYRWTPETRHLLFQTLSYVCSSQCKQHHFLKLGSETEKSIFTKYSSHQKIADLLSPTDDSQNRIYYRSAGGGYWVTFMNNQFDCITSSSKYSSFKKGVNSKVYSAALNSDLFWWYHSINYDLFNFCDYMIFGFQMTYPNSLIERRLIVLSDKMESSLRGNALYYEINSKTKGTNLTVTYQNSKSKPIIDEIDKVLAEHYGFTEEELDFIINYDIKYRMGDELQADRDE